MHKGDLAKVELVRTAADAERMASAVGGWDSFAHFEKETECELGMVLGRWQLSDDESEPVGDVKLHVIGEGIAICGNPSRVYVIECKVYKDAEGSYFCDYNEFT